MGSAIDRQIAQAYFQAWDNLARENTRIWDTRYRPRPLFDDVANWADSCRSIAN